MAPTAEPVVFRAPSGAHYAVSARWADDDGTPRLEIGLDAGDVTALDRDGLFHLVEAARPAALTLDPSVPVVLELRPSPELLGDQGATPVGDPAAGVTTWFAADPRRRRCDAWFATRVSQPEARPPLDARTLWDYVDLPGGAGPDEPDPSSAASAAQTAQAALAFLRDEHPELVGEADGVQRLLDLLGPPGPADTTDALSRLAAVLTDAGSEPTLLDDGSGLRFAMQGQAGSWPCLVQSSAQGALIFYCIYPDVVTPARLAEGYGALGRWNSDQLIGSLDLDPDSGRIVLRTALLLDTQPPSAALLRRTLDQTLDAMDDAWPLLTELTAPVGGTQ